MRLRAFAGIRRFRNRGPRRSLLRELLVTALRGRLTPTPCNRRLPCTEAPDQRRCIRPRCGSLKSPLFAGGGAPCTLQAWPRRSTSHRRTHTRRRTRQSVTVIAWRPALHPARIGGARAERGGPLLRGGVGVANRHHAVLAAVDHQQRRPVPALDRGRGQAAVAHRGQHPGRRVCCAGATPASSRLRRSAPASAPRAGPPCSPPPTIRPPPPRRGRPGRAGRPGRSPRAGRRLGLGAMAAAWPPVPAACGLAGQVLLGIEHQEALARGEPVHARAAREARGVLPAAVQHHQQRQAIAAARLPGGTGRKRRRPPARSPAGDPVAGRHRQR